MKDTFIYAVTLTSCAEALLGFLVLIMNARNARSTATLAFCVNLMILWKSVLYFLQYTELCGGGKYHSHNDAVTNFLYLRLPNLVWIIVPLLVVCRLWGRLSGGAADRLERSSDENIEISYNTSAQKRKKNK